MPKASAKGRSPLDVSSAIEVVMTLVTWSIFPPTIITAPTSYTALPKPAKNMVIKESLLSEIYVITDVLGGTENIIKKSLYSLCNSSKIWVDKDIIIGRIKINWARIIAYGVYKISSQPKGPDLETNKYTINPTTTGGIPIKELKILIVKDLPVKRVIAKKTPIGNPTIEAIRSDVTLIFKDNPTISNSETSKLKIKENALKKASRNTSINI